MVTNLLVGVLPAWLHATRQLGFVRSTRGGGPRTMYGPRDVSVPEAGGGGRERIAFKFGAVTRAAAADRYETRHGAAPPAGRPPGYGGHGLRRSLDARLSVGGTR